MQFRRRFGVWLVGVAPAALFVCSHPVLAQSLPVVSRPVVQALPSADSQRLNQALARASRDPRDFSALIDAGDAANAMGDPEAAAGFYKRAERISPNNARIKAGLGRALVLQGKAAEAIPLFASIENAGPAVDVSSDRGLAYDLVGDPITAQRYYKAVLAKRDEDEVRRRMGISLAIVGDAPGAEAMLMPLLRKQDKPAWRAHAFALAIAGKTKEAVDTVNAILPGPLAQNVTPYLRYMPRLTRAQQAAAVNLGMFPRASEIGRDDPAIAAIAPSAAQVASADASLIPRGQALGGGRSRVASNTNKPASTTLSASERRARDRAALLAKTEEMKTRVAPPEPKPAIDRPVDGELPALGKAAPMAALPTMTPPATPAERPAALTVQPPVSSLAGTTPNSALVRNTAPVSAAPIPPVYASVTTQAAAPVPTPVASPETTTPPSSAAPAATAQASASVVQTQPVGTPPSAFNLTSLPASAPSGTAMQGQVPAPAPAAVPAVGQNSAPVAPSTPASSAVSLSLDQVFSDLGAPSRAATPIAGAVDVRAIEPAKPAPEPAPIPASTSTKAKLPEAEVAQVEVGKVESRSVTTRRGVAARASEAQETPAGSKKATSAKAAAAKKAAAKPALPSHPSRIWIQVGVGRDRSAIAYDWRRSVRESPAVFSGRQPLISDMGRTNRILIGPFENQKAASDMLSKVKKAGLASAFVWTSSVGQAVDALVVN